MATVVVLMATYNGAAFLQPQLDSIAAQAGVDWRLVVSDDGSTDATAAIVDAFAAHHPGRVQRIDGPRAGPEANFRHLLTQTPPEATHAAFCDQDDVWLPHKLARAVEWLGGHADRPALYAARTRIVDSALVPLGQSRPPRRPLCFRNAIVQNYASGNTMVMNRAAVDLLGDCHAEAGPIAMHDWWAYQVITAARGVALYDPEPALLYRQHDANVLGAGHGVRGFWTRVQLLMGGRFHRWNRLNTAALTASAHRFSPDARAVLADFSRALAARHMLGRLGALWRSGAYRQSRGMNAALWIAAILNRI